jgi:Protein of unknown function (DUF1404)
MKPIPEQTRTALHSKSDLKKIVALALFVFAWVNPYVEKLDSQSALVFMFSHYSLCLAGLLLGMSYLRWPRWLWIPGVAFLSLWHLPLFFAFSGNFFVYRVPEEAMIFLGGLLIGSNFENMKSRMKASLFATWIVADSVLSAIFIIAPRIYSSISVSPFGSSGFIITGVGMVLFMNGAIAYVVYIYFKRFEKMQSRLSGGQNNSDFDGVHCFDRRDSLHSEDSAPQIEFVDLDLN